MQSTAQTKQKAGSGSGSGNNETPRYMVQTFIFSKKKNLKIEKEKIAKKNEKIKLRQVKVLSLCCV